MVEPYYQDDYVTLYHGDCREIVPQLGKFDLLLTDPPYGIGVDKLMHSNSGKQGGNAAAPKRHYAATDWDHAPPVEDLLEYVAVCDLAVVWGGNYFALPPARCMLVWDKVNGDNKFADAELAWTNIDGAVRIKRHLWNGMLRKDKEQRYTHPTQKPLEVMKWCIGFAPDAQTILDPFAGSGTTGRAAKDLQRKCTMIELEERYCEIAANRCRQEVLPL